MHSFPLFPQATDMIVAPVGTQSKFKEFCNQGCVDAHELKRQAVTKSGSKSALHPCAVCKKNAKVCLDQCAVCKKNAKLHLN